MELEVTLRDRPDLDRPVVASSGVVVRDSLDRILIVHGQDMSSIQVFDSDGTFVETVGRTGQGPGEFASISTLAVGDDGNIYVFDWRQQRVTTLSPDFTTSETHRLPLRTRSAIVGPRGLTVAARGLSNDLVGLPLHYLDAELDIVTSFGATDETVRPDMQVLQLRSVAPGAGDRIWSTMFHKYLVEEWNPSTGVRQRAFERVVDWFEPWLFGTRITEEIPPQPKLMGAWQDSDGLLWTITIVAAETWAEGLYISPEWNDVMVEDSERLYDSYVEVIDPSTGSLLASRKVPQSFSGFTNDGLMIGLRHPDDEVFQIQLWRPELIRQ